MRKIKQLLSLVLVIVILSSAVNLAAIAASIGSKTASHTNSSVAINGTPTAFQAYNIDGANYFKLRDIAKAINGSAKQFDVGYDSSNNAITLTVGKAYTPVGGELTATGIATNQVAVISSSKVMLNGLNIQLTAYLIGGNNYFKLRDVGTALSFSVIWNANANTIYIDTTGTNKTDPANIGFFDPSVDYSSKHKYKIVYMMADNGPLYDMLDQNFSHWAKRLNCDYSSFTTNGDNNLFISSLEIYATQGVQGFLLDPDYTLYPRINELLKEKNIPWMPCMTAPTDDQGILIHPAVGFDNTNMGVQMATWAIDYAKKTWPNAKDSEIGMLSMDYSLSDQIHERTTGAQSVWDKSYLKTNFFVADSAESADLSEIDGNNLASAAFSSHPTIKYWLVCACIDNYAIGATKAAISSGLQNNCVVINCGGSALVAQWDAGVSNCWRSAVCVAEPLYIEPMICGLYAQMDGQATTQTLWPSWIYKDAGQKYAYLSVPSMVLTNENYQEYLEWVDSYTGFNQADYPYHGTQFPSKATPPAN